MQAHQLLFGRGKRLSRQQPDGRQPGARLPAHLVGDAEQKVAAMSIGQSGWLRASIGMVVCNDRSIWVAPHTTFSVTQPAGRRWVAAKRTATGLTLSITPTQAETMRRGDHAGDWYQGIGYVPVTELFLNDQ